MKIHTDTLTMSDLFDAARIARVEFAEDTPERKGSRSRDHAFTVLLRGESRRAPNLGTRHYSQREYGQHAATWDQWGVFLSVLFDKDPRMTTPYDKGREAFTARTGERFATWNTRGTYWPTDAHGDHTFRFAGVPRQQSCTKCTAMQRWAA